MDIGPVNNKQSSVSMTSDRQDQPGAQNAQPAPEAQSDTVVISSDARARLSEMADLVLRESPPTTAADESPDDEKLNLIRLRMAIGFYDRPEVRAEIADRLIDRALVDEDDKESK